MKTLMINNSLNIIKKYYPEYTEEKLEEIEYGLVSIYLTITKLIVISLIALLLGVFKECIIFTVFYNIIRTTSFGLHATKSWICLLFSTIAFIGVPYICAKFFLPINVLMILGTIGIILIFKNSPADTEKRPIINPKRRMAYKTISTVIAILMVTVSILTNDSFISNALIAALLLQSFIVSPFAYKLFNLPYDNYKNYIDKY